MKRALIVIDVQESFRALPSWERIANPKIADSVDRLVRLARAEGDQVIWVLHTEPGSGGVFDPEQGRIRLLEELERPAPGEAVLHKTAHRLERAEHLIGQGSTVTAAARDVGFDDARMLRRLRARAL
ncbi:hypothetical protein GCM10017744_025270 [Streptomyces antimycoticus]|uniref:Isochorismatase-like domain-containing protein n=1 Tax=Streptomyces antimycoticus TaxID=68175 RepID=A0A4D4KF96_9ACTN|nr:isochorismatase family protein [Streptomyces antimycoticus]GDY46824.1 hypothetical protein SANT12839_077060 [Streptomyces antimycoticus]